MKPEIGRQYRTRGGHKAIVVADHPFPGGRGTTLLGAVQFADGSSVPVDWNRDGQSDDSDFDLSSEWKDPKPFRVAAYVHVFTRTYDLEEVPAVVAFPTEELARQHRGAVAGLVQSAIIPITVFGEFP